MQVREKILKIILGNKKLPRGDLNVWQEENRYKISAVFIFYQRIALMEQALEWLRWQNFPGKDLEIVLVEDRGGSREGRELSAKFPELSIKYSAPQDPNVWGITGSLRNYGLSLASGEIVLFLDDDTLVMDNDFLSKLYGFFENDLDLMAVIPRGVASFCLIKPRYQYHDPHFFTSRCTAYRRLECLIRLGGFRSDFVGQEDVEFAMRFLAMGFKYITTEELVYYHPPLLVPNLRKPQSVGYSFAKAPYPFPVRLCFALNGSRWLYRWLCPTFKNRQMGRFALGFLLGFVRGVLGLKSTAYI
ncbi:MAG: glycosyltransferase [Thermodesulforhabdaceae bacterium]